MTKTELRNSKPSLAIVSDSYGIERSRNAAVLVSDDLTWPRIIAGRLPERRVRVDCKGFRRLVDCPPVAAAIVEPDSDLVVHAGIVDCYPRPLGAKLGRDPRLFPKILRQLIRPWRRLWLTYVHTAQWATWTEMERSIVELANLVPQGRLLLLTVPPVVADNSRVTPGAQDALFRLNDMFRRMALTLPNVEVVDAQLEAMRVGINSVLDAVDSHYAVEGNALVARMLLDALSGRAQPRPIPDRAT